MFRSAATIAAIALVAVGGAWWRYRRPAIPSTPTPQVDAAPSFDLREVGERLGIDFRHDPGHPCYYYPEIMGGGVALADFNGDGRLDVLLRGCLPGKGHPHARPGPTSRLYLQNPDGTFTDATKTSGLTDDDYAMGVAVGDVNNDGIPDVYFCNYGEDKLYIGNGDGTFIDVTESAGISNGGYSTSASFVDFDRDGRLDLYVANYTGYSKYIPCTVGDGWPEYCQPTKFSGLPHKLYRNVTPAGAGPLGVRFEDVSEKSGIGAKKARGLGVLQCDVNDDGWPDLFVANDVEPNFLWINQQDGSFLESAVSEGTAVNAAGQPQASMGVAECDVDGDGKMDLLATNFRNEYTIAYCRRDYGFRDLSGALGLMSLTQPFTGFGIAALDLDADGFDEIIQLNGRVTRVEADYRRAAPTEQSTAEEIKKHWSAYAERSQIFFKAGGRFEDAKERAGDFGRWVGIGRALAVGDLDGDGRSDFVALDLVDRARVFLNKTPAKGNWLSVRAIDPAKGGRDALGALVVVFAKEKRVARRIRSCGSYQSAREPCVEIGLGGVDKIDRIEVVWPDGDLKPQIFDAPSLNQRIVLKRRQGDGTR